MSFGRKFMIVVLVLVQLALITLFWANDWHIKSWAPKDQKDNYAAFSYLFGLSMGLCGGLCFIRDKDGGE